MSNPPFYIREPDSSTALLRSTSISLFGSVLVQIFVSYLYTTSATIQFKFSVLYRARRVTAACDRALEEEMRYRKLPTLSDSK